MKCPRCGTEMAASKICSKCNLDITDFRDKIEVEYKDFKTSELLEIRQKRQTAPSGVETETVREPHRGEILKSEGPAETTFGSGKRYVPMLAIALLILILVVGAFFLFRNLIMQ
jgi:hypothetical protein